MRNINKKRQQQQQKSEERKKKRNIDDTKISLTVLKYSQCNHYILYGIGFLHSSP